MSGLSATGAVTVALVAGLVGGAYDALASPGLGLVFGTSFVLGCLLAVLLVRARDLRVTVVMPPLVYAGITLVAGVLLSGSAAPSVTREALGLFTSLVLEAPALLIAEALVVVVALLRGVAARRATRPMHGAWAREGSRWVTPRVPEPNRAREPR